MTVTLGFVHQLLFAVNKQIWSLEQVPDKSRLIWSVKCEAGAIFSMAIVGDFLFCGFQDTSIGVSGFFLPV